MTALRPLSLLLACSSLLLTAQDAGQRLKRAPRAHKESEEEREGRKEAAEKDDARKRRDAMKEWFGGEWSPEYRKFILQAAATERERYAAQLPGLSSEAGLVASGNTWTNIGPTNADSETNGSTLFVRDSGRPVSIVPHPTDPNTIFLATAGGGVWKTTNGGTNWTPITETVGSLSCGYLTLDPGNPNVLYLGLGDAFDGTGIGLLKSTDGGATWSAPVYLGNATVINAIAVNPQNGSILLAATNTGLYRSTDGGATWAAVSVGGLTAPYCWTLAYTGGGSFALSLEVSHGIATGTSDGRVYTSSDAGATWAQGSGLTATNGVGRISMASAPSLPSTLYAMGAVPNAASPSTDLADIWKSTDGGATWTSTGAATKNYSNTNAESSAVNALLGGQGFYNHAVLVDRTNPAVAYFGGQLLLAKTTNSGGTFSQTTNWLAQYSLPYVHADFHCAAIGADGAVYAGTDGGIFKSTDNGATWTSNLNIGITSHLIYSVGSTLANRSVVIGGFQDNGTRVRSGGTTTYNQQIGGDGFGAHAHATSASNLLGTLYYARVYKSTNGGSTFSSASSGITESNNSSSAPFNTKVVPGLADATGNTVYTFSNTKVYKSTNYATSWTAVGATGLPTTSFYIRNVGSAKANGSVIGLVANGGRVYTSGNGGSSWTAAAALPNTGNSLSYLWYDTNNASVLYVASVAPDAIKNHLWKSSNGGASWTTIDGSGFPVGVPVNAIQNDPGDSNTLYAGTHLGVYKSTDGGTSWTRFGSGLPLVNVTDFYLAPDSSLMRASTFGRGFWELQAGVTAPTITTQPSSQAVNAGATATFSVTATGTGLSYQWRKNGTAIAGATAASYTTPATTTADSGSTFSVVVSNSAGSATSANATLTVNPVSGGTFMEVEANDSLVTANAVASTYTAIQGTLPATTDVDTFALTLTPGQKVTIAMTGPTGPDWDLFLKNAAGTTLTSSEGATTTETLTYTNTGATSLTVYPQVTVYSGTSTTPYTLALTYVTPIPTVTYNEAEANGSIAAANAVPDNATKIVGYIASATDNDYFAVNVAAGKTVKVNMTGPTGSTYDYDLYFYNASGTQLAASEGATTTETASWTNTGATTAKVYVAVKRYAGSSTTTPYTLTLTR